MHSHFGNNLLENTFPDRPAPVCLSVSSTEDHASSDTHIPEGASEQSGEVHDTQVREPVVNGGGSG